MLRDPIGDKVDSDLRLPRAQGTIQVLATHRLADFVIRADGCLKR